MQTSTQPQSHPDSLPISATTSGTSVDPTSSLTLDHSQYSADPSFLRAPPTTTTVLGDFAEGYQLMSTAGPTCPSQISFIRTPEDMTNPTRSAYTIGPNSDHQGRVSGWPTATSVDGVGTADGSAAVPWGGLVNKDIFPSLTYGGMLDRTPQGSFHDTYYDSSTRTLRCTVQEVLPEPTEQHEWFEGLKADWHKFDLSAFMKLTSQKFLPNAGKSLRAYLVGTTASAILVTLAQMLHVNMSECECNADNVFHEESFQLDFRKMLMTVLPASEELKSELPKQRTRYALTLLERKAASYGIPVEQLLLHLQRDERATKAARCLTSSLNHISKSHDDFLGRWAWEGLISKLIPLSSSGSAFTGWPGNPGPRSPTTDLDGGSEVRSVDKPAPPRNAKTHAQGMTPTRPPESS